MRGATNLIAMQWVLIVPDWNSLDSVRRAHSYLEGAALLFFAALVIFDVLAHLTDGSGRGKFFEKIGLCFFAVAVLAEIVAYPYGQRNDTLSEKIIGSLDVKAQQADQDASQAISDSASALTKARGANEAAGLAKSSADNSLNLAKSAERTAKELDQQVSLARNAVESVDAKRAELQQFLTNMAVCAAPRIIPDWRVRKNDSEMTSIDPLKAYAGHEVIIEVVQDAEAKRAALNIARALNEAGWKIARMAFADDIPDGVQIQPYTAPIPTSAPDAEYYSLWASEKKANEVAYALIDFLQSYNWQVSRGWPVDQSGTMIRDPKVLPPGDLRIRVGLYPPVMYAAPPGGKGLTDEMARAEQEREAAVKRNEAIGQRREQELLARLPPQLAESIKQRAEENRELQDSFEKRFRGPCRTTPLSFSMYQIN